MTGASASVLAGALCLSISAIVVKLAGVDAATTAMLRCAIAVIALAPLAVLESRRRGPLTGAGIGWSLAAGVALGLDYAAWTASIYHVGAGISTVLINVQVIVLPALAFFIDREPVTRRFLLALPLMIVGITLVGGLWNHDLRDRQAVVGTLLAVAAGAGYATYLFITRRSSGSDPGRMIQQLAWATAAAAVTTTVVSPLSGGLSFTGITTRSWAWLVVLAIVGQVVAWLFVNYGSIRLAPATTAGLLLVQPVLALALSAVIVDEHPSALQIAGALVVLAGVATTHGLVRRRRHAP